MTNQTEYRTAIGLDNVVIAQVTQDDSGAYVAGPPIYLAPAAEMSGAPKSNEEILYYDDGPYETLSSEGVTERKLKISALPPEIEALIYGETYDAVSGRMYDSATPANAPYFALGYRSLKSNGHYRYFWFLKGKFQKGGEEHATLGEKAEGKPVELTYNAIKTVHKFTQGARTDGLKRVKLDEDSDNANVANWFAAVQTPETASPAALTLSASPADAATGVLVTANVVLTFSNKIRSGNAGIMLLTAAGVPVAGAYSWDADVKVLTIDPTSDLVATTDYLVVLADVTDIYGQTLADTVINFTTA